jgi:hypothetical protein
VNVRAAAAALLCLLMAACTGERAERPHAAAGRAAGPSLELAVVARPLDCQPTADVPAGCEVGGSGTGAGLGKVRVFHQVRLARTSTGDCLPATVTGSISGAGWAVPFAGEGEWCGREGRFGYRLGGQRAATGRLEYRHGASGTASETFSGPLPLPPAADAAGAYADRRLASAGCRRRPPVRPGRAVDLTVPADPALAAGARSRGYRVHLPAGTGRDIRCRRCCSSTATAAAPPTWTPAPACRSWPTGRASWRSTRRAPRSRAAAGSGPTPAG